ncbi:hypothetical protein KP509_01G116500 [Ceratopteris richardii]|uniref:Uncharacterized protein n=1 Tax=Ceratopteris richardii TaxID=49495 RepID=A0A8T2VQA1_CERRI|nr:hypothetical protein KP509_01G116500 [Ceratopteris richardii]
MTTKIYTAESSEQLLREEEAEVYSVLSSASPVYHTCSVFLQTNSIVAHRSKVLLIRCYRSVVYQVDDMHRARCYRSVVYQVDDMHRAEELLVIIHEMYYVEMLRTCSRYELQRL